MRKVILKSLVSAGLEKFSKPAEPFGDCCGMDDSATEVEELGRKEKGKI